MSLHESAVSLAKLLLKPRRASVRAIEQPRPLIILGNGPSLNQTMAESADSLAENPLMAVNFFANTPQFRELKPEYYVLADPHFFQNQQDPNVAKLTASLRAVDWPMTLLVPFGARPDLGGNPNITVEHFPMTAVEGSAALERMAYGARLGMPRPRNVLIPSIMCGAWLGFRDIYIVGADHSWMTSISVNERNEVVSIQPHFYKEDDKELERVRVDYLRHPLHEVVKSFYVAFRSYHQIERWATRKGINIYNSTPSSFIDAFRRQPLP